MTEQKQFPEEFVERVKALFPACHDLHQLLDIGDQSVGAYLYKKIHRPMEPNEIIAMIDEGRIKELRIRLNQQVQGSGLYRDWLDICVVTFRQNST